MISTNFRAIAFLIKWCLTERAFVVMRCVEPLVETRFVELILASFASKVWEGIVGDVEDGIANWATLNAFEMLIEVVTPEEHGVQKRTISREQEGTHR